MWTDNYIGLPFIPDGRSRDGLDCWGLVKLVYEEQLGIILPSYDGVFKEDNIKNLRVVSDLMDKEREKWIRVEKPTEFDVLMMRIQGRVISHVGIYLNKNKMLHIIKGISSVIEPTTGINWKDRIVGAYRHADRC